MKQNWSVGNVVSCGFLKLTVTQIIPTPGDYRPDIYLLADAKHSDRFYQFTPYYGVERLNATTLDNAHKEISEGRMS